MRAGDLEIEQRLLIVGSLLGERGECVGHFEDRRLAGAVAGDGDVGVALRVGDCAAGVVDAADGGERFVMRGGETPARPRGG